MHSYDDILHWVVNYFVYETMTSPEFLGKNTTLYEMGRDQYVDKLLLVIAIESEYDLSIQDDEFDAWKTLDDVAKTIFKKECT